MGDYKSDEYTEAATASAEWWKGAPFKRTLCLVGGHEILRDASQKWYDNYKVYLPTGPHEPFVYSCDNATFVFIIWVAGSLAELL
jgi:hypothetical protein